MVYEHITTTKQRNKYGNNPQHVRLVCNSLLDLPLTGSRKRGVVVDLINTNGHGIGNQHSCGSHVLRIANLNNQESQKDMISVILNICICGGGRRRARNTQNTLGVSRGCTHVEPIPHLTCWAK